MWLQLRLQCLQARAGQLARANFGAPIETQGVRGTHNHDVDWDFDAGEMEEIPARWWWLELLFCLRAEVFCRGRPPMAIRAGPGIDEDFH